MADILRTVGVMGVVLVALWLVGQLVTRTPDQPTSAVDYQQAARSVADAVTFDVVAPRTLPQGWYANDARLNDAKQWHLGVVTDDQDYVGLEQAKVSATELVRRMAPGSRADGTVTIDGQEWTRRTASGDERVLVREADGAATLVLSKGLSAAELSDYVSSFDVVSR